MNDARKPPPPVSGPAAALVRPVQVIGRVGINLLPFFDDQPAPPPATNASWAWSLRRFARAGLWLLPGYAILFGVVTFGGRPAPSSSTAGSLHLVGWTMATFAGLLGLMALTCLLVTARSRAAATAGLLAAVAGSLLLPFAELPSGTSVYGTEARTLAVAGGTIYSLGWLAAGWAVVSSQVFGPVDGVLLMVASPLVGFGGLLLGVLQTLGALLVLAAGIGVAWKATRLLPRYGGTLTVDPPAVAAQVAGGAPAAP